MRKIGVMIGSDSDLPQCIKGLELLENAVANAQIQFTYFDVNSIHRHTLLVLDTLKAYDQQRDFKGGVDVLIIGAGMANHLTGCVDAFLRHTLRNHWIIIYGVAFENEYDSEGTKAAVLSITQVPSTNVIFRDYVGSEGFFRACNDAIYDDLQPIELPSSKPYFRWSLQKAISMAYKKKKEKEEKQKGGK